MLVTPILRMRFKMRKQGEKLNKGKSGLHLILALLALLALVLVLSGKSSTNTLYGTDAVTNSKLRGNNNAWVTPDAQPFNEYEASKADHLIMVAGHSVIVSGHLFDAGSDEKDWFLLDYQKGRGLPQAIVAHIRAGIQEAAKDPYSILIFSGGETRASVGPVNEGTSYFRVADAMDLWNEPLLNEEADASISRGASTVRARAVAEEFATDSFQNLFKEVTGSYPRKITSISFSFKQKRFEQLHAAALRWPSDRFVFLGVDPDVSTGFDLEESTEGELNNAARPFETDPYGCNTDVLKEKRKGRNPFSRTPPYELTCPEMKSLFTWCGPDFISHSLVPWQ